MGKAAIDIFHNFLTTEWASLLGTIGFKGQGFEYCRYRGLFRELIQVEPTADGSAVHVSLAVHSRRVRTSGDYDDSGPVATGDVIRRRYLAMAGCTEGFWTIEPKGPVTLKTILEDMHAHLVAEGMTFFANASTIGAPAANTYR